MLFCRGVGSCENVGITAKEMGYLYIEGTQGDVHNNLVSSDILLPINGTFEARFIGGSPMQINAYDSRNLSVNISDSYSGCQISLNAVSFFRYEQAYAIEGLGVDIDISSVLGDFPRIIYEEAVAAERASARIYLPEDGNFEKVPPHVILRAKGEGGLHGAFVGKLIPRPHPPANTNQTLTN